MSKMQTLKGKIALVTGASRGIGKGVALALGEAGATVYVTGRTVEEGKAAVLLPGTVHQTSEEVTRRGGQGIAVPCDHRDDAQVKGVFDRIEQEQGRLDILVNAVWGGYEQFANGSEYNGHLPFWQRPLSQWDTMHSAGVRAHFIASALAIPLMLKQQDGLIGLISSFAGRKPGADVPYSCAHASMDHMAGCLAEALREQNITAVSLAPGMVRTENVLLNKEFLDLSVSESPQFTGRAVVALAQDNKRIQKTGQWLGVAELAEEYGFTDLAES